MEDTLPPLFLDVPADAYFEELEQAVRKEAGNPAFEGASVVPHLLRNRQPFEALNAIGRTEGIDLIVVATHGRTGVQRFLLGSFAERVVRTSASKGGGRLRKGGAPPARYWRGAAGCITIDQPPDAQAGGGVTQPSSTSVSSSPGPQSG